MVETTQCPNCQTSLSGGARYCAKCGYGTKDGKPIRIPFDWKLVAFITFLVPLTVCGGCIAFGNAYDGPTKGSFNTYAIIEFSSFGLGILMILVNIVVSVWRQK